MVGPYLPSKDYPHRRSKSANFRLELKSQKFTRQVKQAYLFKMRTLSVIMSF